MLLDGGDNVGATFGVIAPLKFFFFGGGDKNVQNLVRFTTTFEFGRKYLWNE